MKKRHSSAIKFLAGTLAAAVLSCMVSVSMVKPQKIQAADDSTATPTASINVSSLTLPIKSSFGISVTVSDGSTPTWTWSSGDEEVAKVKTKEGAIGAESATAIVTAAEEVKLVSGSAVEMRTRIVATATIDGKTVTASCPVTVNPRITSPVSTPNTSPAPSTPATPTQPSTDPTNPSTPTEPTNPSTPTTPTEPDTPDMPAPGQDNPPVAPNPGPVETVPPANTVVLGVTINDDGTVVDAKGALVRNAIVDENGTKYITNGSGEKIVNKIVTAKDGTMYGTLADGRVAWSATFILGGKKYFAAADGSIAVKKFSTTPYDHRVYSRANGTLVQNKLFKVNGKRYYARKSGALVQSKWVKVGNQKYYCNAKGVITKSKKA